MADKQPLVRDGSLQQDKGYWVVRARVYDPVRRKYKHRSKTTGIKTKEHRKKEAERMIPAILANWEKEAQAALYPVPDDPPFSVYVTRYLEARTKDLKATTATAYKSNARLHVLPKLGDRKVSEVKTLSVLQGFVNELLESRNVKTVKKIMVIVSGALDEAALDGVIDVNPTNSVRYPKAEKVEKRAFTKEQVNILLQAAEEAGEPLRAAIVLGVCYGLRRSEVLGLRWSDIDFDNALLHVRNTVTWYASLREEEEKTKTEAGTRDIDLLGTTIPYLRKLKQTQQEKGMTLGKVCAWPDGRGVREEYISNSLKKLEKKVGLPDLTYHELRHTAASLLAPHVTDKQLQEFMGHEDISTTKNIYVHQNEEERKKTSKKMDEILTGAPARQGTT